MESYLCRHVLNFVDLSQNKPIKFNLILHHSRDGHQSILVSLLLLIDEIRLHVHFWNEIHLHPAGFLIEVDHPGDVPVVHLLWAPGQVPAGDGGHDEDLPAGVQQGTVPVLQEN